MPDIRPLVLSGGSGTRLWPLSTSKMPKQFADLLGGTSLFERTLARLPDSLPPIIVAGAAHADLVERACDRAGVTPFLVILEPSGRNTAPASIAGAMAADPDDVLVILPSDHLIADIGGFRARVEEAARHAREGRIVVFGITPDRPETGFGYISCGEAVPGGWEVAEFVEKPELSHAEQMLEDGGYLWNSGIFVLTSRTLLEETGRFAPGLLAGVDSASGAASDGRIELGPGFAEVENISFDHAVMEKTERGVVLPLQAGWDDVGSFQALWAASNRDDEGNAVEGDVVLKDVESSLIKATSRRVAVAGVAGLVIIETPEAVLVVPRDRAQLVRDLVTGEG